MAATVFVWDMFKNWGVGHASLYLSGGNGSIYVSVWPQMHNLQSGILSHAKIHFINADKLADGTPSWASKPITDLDESKVIKWWGRIQSNPLIDYQHKKAFQISNNETTNYQQAEHEVTTISYLINVRQLLSAPC